MMWILLLLACRETDPGTLRLHPAAPTATDALRCLDKDGHPVAASWTVGDQDMGTSTRLELSTIAPGSTVTCRSSGLSQHTTVRPERAPVGGNMLILIADDLGVDKMGLYEPEAAFPSTPNLDALAAEGVTFSRAYANSICSPTRATILTGRHARRYGVGTGINVARMNPSLPGEEVLLPEMLAEASYTSAAVGKWHLTSDEVEVHTEPGRQGFAHFAGSATNLLDGQLPGQQGQDYFNWVKMTGSGVSRAHGYATTITVDDALEFARTMPEPWLIYLSFHAPHKPFHVPPRQLARGPSSSAAQKYDRMVEAMDHEIGRLMDGLGAQRERTSVFFVGDNGTPKDAVRKPYPKDRAKGTLYEGGVHVPLIVSGPAVEDGGRHSDALIHTVDIFPTIAEMAGVQIEHTLDGRSFLPVLQDPEATGDRTYVYVEMFGPSGCTTDCDYDQRALISRRWKLLRRDRRAVLYDLEVGEDREDLLRPPLDGVQQTAWTRMNAQLRRQTAWLDHEESERSERRRPKR